MKYIEIETIRDCLRELNLRVNTESFLTDKSLQFLSKESQVSINDYRKSNNTSVFIKTLRKIFLDLLQIEDKSQRKNVGITLFGTCFEDLRIFE